MKPFLRSFLFAAFCLLLFAGKLSAQNDCCGMGSIFSSIMQSGIFGGYGIQQYSAEGWNDYISSSGLSENFSDYGSAHGWLVGANLIGIRQKDFLVALKFYYQSVSEKQDADGTYLGEPATQELDLTINNWSLGVSFSYILNNNFDFRIFDALMRFTSADLTNKIRYASGSVTDEYSSPDANIGFTFDTGLVYYPLPPYISIEVVGGYSIFSVKSMEDENGNELNTTSDFIDGGGFFANAVLTFGIPFN